MLTTIAKLIKYEIGIKCIRITNAHERGSLKFNLQIRPVGRSDKNFKLFKYLDFLIFSSARTFSVINLSTREQRSLIDSVMQDYYHLVNYDYLVKDRRVTFFLLIDNSSGLKFQRDTISIKL